LNWIETQFSSHWGDQATPCVEWSRREAAIDPVSSVSCFPTLSDLDSFGVTSAFELGSGHRNIPLALEEYALPLFDNNFLLPSITNQNLDTDFHTTSPSSSEQQTGLTETDSCASPTSAAIHDTMVLPPPNWHRCQKCSRVFTDTHQLRRHMRTHSRVVCSLQACGSTFTSQKDLDRHKRTVHRLSPRLFCQCGKTFTRKDHLIRHARKFDMKGHGEAPMLSIGPRTLDAIEDC